jgi:alpha-glucosidase
MLALPGSAYIYQGDELGLAEVTDLPAAARTDPTFRRTAGAEVGRDGCRVPIPWSTRTPSLGFGPGPAAWLPQPASWAALSVERQEADEGSVLSLYREALRLRRTLPQLGEGTLEWIDSPPDTLAFRRHPDFVCIVNLGVAAIALPAALSEADVVLASGPRRDGRGDDQGHLAGGTAIWTVERVAGS